MEWVCHVISGRQRTFMTGRGLCVTTCPAKAIKLVKKPEDQFYVAAATYMDMCI